MRIQLLLACMILACSCINASKPVSNKEPITKHLNKTPISRDLLKDQIISAKTLVDRLDYQQFKQNIKTLSNFGNRNEGSSSYAAADNWIEEQLALVGYNLERHFYTYNGSSRSNIYVTKVGIKFPNQMYIVSAHLDGRSGGSADDNGSGVSLVLEAARVMAGLDVETDISVRFIFWNNEETGLNGSTNYVRDRLGLQGIEKPPGSGIYPEPIWLGIIQNDMVLYDHGLPPEAEQIKSADIDIEYEATSSHAFQSLNLAKVLQSRYRIYYCDYPAEIGPNMNFTDSVSFENHTAAISIRENQRITEIGYGSNPYHHTSQDLFQNYSEDDFWFGFNTLQMTLGTVAELAGARITS